MEVGQKVQFIPYFYANEKYAPGGGKPKPVVGTVIFVNRRMFVVEYELNGHKLRQSFLFFDIGKTVNVYKEGSR